MKKIGVSVVNSHDSRLLIYDGGSGGTPTEVHLNELPSPLTTELRQHLLNNPHRAQSPVWLYQNPCVFFPHLLTVDCRIQGHSGWLLEGLDRADVRKGTDDLVWGIGTLNAQRLDRHTASSALYDRICVRMNAKRPPFFISI